MFTEGKETVVTRSTSLLDQQAREAEACDYAAKENVQKLYYELKQWERDLNRYLAAAETPSQLINLGHELICTTQKIMILRDILIELDPDALTYSEGGAVDDCRYITTQSVVVRRTFCQMIKEGMRIDDVVQCGLEYPHTGSYARPYNQTQLDAASSAIESRKFRTERYQEDEVDENGRPVFERHISMVALHTNLEDVMNILWNAKEDGKSYTGGGNLSLAARYRYLELTEIEKKLGPMRDFKTGELIRAAMPVHKSMIDALKLLKKRGFIEVDNMDGIVRVRARITRLAYNVACSNMDDFNMVSERARHEPQVYRRGGEFYPRVGIVMNMGGRPMFVDDDAVKNIVEYEHDIVAKRIYEGGRKDSPTGYIKKFRRITSPGIPFRGSYQLHPEEGRDYDQSGKYSLRTEWSELVRDVFLKSLASNNSKRIKIITGAIPIRCEWNARHVDENGHVIHDKCFKYANGQDPIDGQYNCYEHAAENTYCNDVIRYRYKRQAYMKVLLPKDAYTDVSDKPKYVLVFTDLRSPFDIDGLTYVETCKEEDYVKG